MRKASGNTKSPQVVTLAPDYFFRSRFALALARRSHGAISEAIEAWPKLDISVIPVDIAAAAFSTDHALVFGGRTFILGNQEHAACDGLPRREC